METKHNEIDDLRDSLENAIKQSRKHVDKAKEAEMELLDLKNELARKIDRKGNICDKGFEKYNKTVDKIYEAGKKHKDMLLNLKEISDNQKIKITCLRKHRDEIKANLDKLKDVHEISMKENEMNKASLEEEILTLKRKVDDQNDELESKRKEIHELKESRNANVLKSTSNSIADELEQVNVEDKLKKKRLDALEHLNELGKKRNQEISNLREGLERLKVERSKSKPRCAFEWACKKWSFCKFDHTYLYRKVNNNSVKPREEHLSCSLCGKRFNSGDTLMNHANNCIVVEVEVSNFPCDACNKSYQSISKLRKHKKKEHVSDEVSCTSCGKFFVSEDHIKEHECNTSEHDEIKVITNMLDKILESDMNKNDDDNQQQQDEETDPRIIKKKTMKKNNIVKGRHTKNVDFYRGNLVMINSESMFLDGTVNDSNEELSTEVSSSEESYLEDSETENGEVYSDIESPA